MRLTTQQLLNLPVYTQSEVWLGHINGLELDAGEHRIVKYFVQKTDLVNRLLGSVRSNAPLAVAPTQVVSLSAERMIVADTVMPEVAKVDSVLRKPAITTSAVASLQQTRD